MNQLGFEGAKEAFSDRIIPTIATTTHAPGYRSLLKGYLVVIAGILRTSVGMEQ
jgi:hypothetical protein